MNPKTIHKTSSNGVQTGALNQELDWLAACIDHQIGQFLTGKLPQESPFPNPPILPDDGSPFFKIALKHQWNLPERMAIALALAAELRPGLLLDFAQKSRQMPEVGLNLDKETQLILPGFRTILFLLSGPEILKETQLIRKLFQGFRPFKLHFLESSQEPKQASFLQTKFQLSREGFYAMIMGQELKPDFSLGFPAQRLETKMEWDDLILDPSTLAQVNEVKLWIKHKQALMHDLGLDKYLAPGFKALFHGSPGTGKTLTATLLGKVMGKEVYRIDLSQIVSKYIGETEKNLSKVFDFAQSKEWILFFDEADALFGKRGKVSDARDRYANQEVSYLLQRIETFDGLCILATNFKDNIDPAFSRRLNTIVNFPKPNQNDRLRLWQKVIPKEWKLASGLDLKQIAAKYDLAGGSIMNIVRYLGLRILERGDQTLHLADIQVGAKREYIKEGRIV